MNICEPFIRRPIGTVLLAFGLFLLGAVAYTGLPVASLPNVDLPVIRVSADQPGADPATMAATVAAPLERHLGEIAGVDQITSVSALGSTNISVQFDLSRDIDGAARDVQAAINAAQIDLPADMPRQPQFRKSNPTAAPILILALTSNQLGAAALYDAADTVVAQRISQVEGVSEATVSGAEQPAIRVQVDPTRLAAIGVGLDDVRKAIVEADTMNPLGGFNGRDQATAIATNGQITKAKEYRPLVIKTASGAVVHLSGIATVEAGARNSRRAGWFNGRPAVLIFVRRQTDANVVATVDRVRAMIPELRRWIPAAIDIETVADRTQTIRASVDDLQLTLAASAALVMLVVFLFLRRGVPTLAAGVTVPLSLAGTVALMWASGFSLDNLSLMALTISVGFVVDDAIVMIENVYRNLEAGMRPLRAALQGSRQIGFTVVSISLSLIAAFIPLLFLGGIMGRFLREFALTLTFAILVSAVVSLTVTPMLCGRLFRRSSLTRQTLLDRLVEPALRGMTASYARSLRWVLRHRFVMLAVTVLTIAGTVELYVVTPKGLLPEGDSGLIRAITEVTPDASFARVVALQERVSAVIAADPAIATVATFVGSSDYAGGNQGRMYLSLKPRNQREVSIFEVIDRLRQQLAPIAGARVFMSAIQDIPSGGRSDKSPYEVTLWSADLAALDRWTPQVLAVMRKLPGLRDVSTDREQGGPEATLVVDRMAAARLGISVEAIDAALNDAFSQRQISTIYKARNQYKVVLEVSPRFRADLAGLRQIYVSGKNGAQVPLATLTRVSRTVAPLVVNHEGQFPSVTISYALPQDAPVADATARIEDAIAQLHPPDALHVEVGGGAALLTRGSIGEPLLIAAALLTVYLVLGILYESLLHPLTIISTLPAAGLGALLALQLTGNTLSLIALIGVILLIGIVQKNGIMLVDFALEGERERGLGPEASILEACIERLRPITMTTLAAIFGALPLVIASGPGSELRRPLGITIVGGLIVAQLLTIYTTPVIYLLLDRLRWRLTRRGRRAAAHGLPAPAE